MSRAIIVMRCWLVLYAEQISVCIKDNASSVEWLRLKPHFSLVRWFSDSKNQDKRLFIIFSRSLFNVLISDIGL